MITIDLTQDIRNGMLKALSDIGNRFNKNSFPLDDEEINAIIKDTLNYLDEGSK